MDSDDLKHITDRILKFKLMSEPIGQGELIGKQISAVKNARRSLVYSKDLEIGHVIKKSDLIAKRPGSGLSVKKYKSLIERELRVEVKADDLVSFDDFN